ncbi:unnamed protein product, partial [Polarella glacialis]
EAIPKPEEAAHGHSNNTNTNTTNSNNNNTTNHNNNNRILSAVAFQEQSQKGVVTAQSQINEPTAQLEQQQQPHQQQEEQEEEEEEQQQQPERLQGLSKNGDIFLRADFISARHRLSEIKE